MSKPLLCRLGFHRTRMTALRPGTTSFWGQGYYCVRPGCDYRYEGTPIPRSSNHNPLPQYPKPPAPVQPPPPLASLVCSAVSLSAKDMNERFAAFTWPEPPDPITHERWPLWALDERRTPPVPNKPHLFRGTEISSLRYTWVCQTGVLPDAEFGTGATMDIAYANRFDESTLQTDRKEALRKQQARQHLRAYRDAVHRRGMISS